MFDPIVTTSPDSQNWIESDDFFLNKIKWVAHANNAIYFSSKKIIVDIFYGYSAFLNNKIII